MFSYATGSQASHVVYCFNKGKIKLPPPKKCKALILLIYMETFNLLKVVVKGRHGFSSAKRTTRLVYFCFVMLSPLSETTLTDIVVLNRSQSIQQLCDSCFIVLLDSNGKKYSHQIRSLSLSLYLSRSRSRFRSLSLSLSQRGMFFTLFTTKTIVPGQACPWRKGILSGWSQFKVEAPGA